MTMEERSSGIEDGSPVISTGATINTTNGSNNPKIKAYERTTDASYPLQRTSKRSFDVAFLVAPDEKMIKRQSEKLVNLQFCTNQFVNDSITQHERSVTDDQVDDSHEYEQSDKIPQNMTIKHFESIEASKFKIRRCEDKQTTLSPYVTMKRRLTSNSSSLSPEPHLTPHLYAESVHIQKSPSPPGVFQRTLHVRKVFVDEKNNDRPIGQTLMIPGSRNKSNCENMSCLDRLQGDTRSAFTKVNLAVQRGSLMGVSPGSSNINFEDGTGSPRSSVSPDVITYQNSLSPPIAMSSSNGSGGSFNNKYASPFPTKMPYPFLMSPDSQQTTLLDKLKLGQHLANQTPPKVPSPKIPNTGFRPELPSVVYPNLPYNSLSTVFPPIGDALVRPRFLAAGLLPSSFAALALPAQNVCAKCNLSFRMTSDLVYHMRSHHKNESVGEAARRRREEKLRCPVCDESFRERHHLTRHMTAHQDKESDAVVDQVEIKRRSAATLLHGK
ncbi:PREDICTED: uncharacterized protein LOC105367251 [Ceratosolen solmsi marchali]|uniref:Uncharacterized protein LOC105367251 n=1 Tax=Ceratosolen solmsi marchali TaxID=326594 RepID=A0AAJ6YTL0_9HYME|nr:PREDICTED: uncharacterized protein LOC105367251 [Ceratosolen solmsi marchali]